MSLQLAAHHFSFCLFVLNQSMFPYHTRWFNFSTLIVGWLKQADLVAAKPSAPFNSHMYRKPCTLEYSLKQTHAQKSNLYFKTCSQCIVTREHVKYSYHILYKIHACDCPIEIITAYFNLETNTHTTTTMFLQIGMYIQFSLKYTCLEKRYTYVVMDTVISRSNGTHIIKIAGI